MSAIQTKKVAGYVVMPGIIPRVKGLFASGFGYVAFLMAQIYAMVRLLPPNHAYLNPENIGKFNIRQVIAQAANHLVLKKENIDQMVIFLTILMGLMLIVIQIAMLVFTLIFEPALASYPAGPHPTGPSIFVTADPTFDMAFMLLDQVFGVGNGADNFFDSCIAQGIDCGGSVSATPVGSFPWPFHNALHDLFRFYNTGILLIGALIFLYFMLIVIGETAVTGTPFGQRFQSVWVPIRLVVAIGLLIPLNYGFNSGQYLTFFAAKAGSSFATNGWTVYNNTIRLGSPFPGGAGANPLGERESLIGIPATPDVSPFVQSMSLLHTCAMGYWYQEGDDALPLAPDAGFEQVQAYFYKDAADWMPNTDQVLEITAGTSYADALDFYNNGDVKFYFGTHGDINGDNNIEGDDETKARENGRHCGEIKVNIHKVGTTLPLIGAEAIQEYYFDMVRNMWFNAGDPPTQELRDYGYRTALLKMQSGNNASYITTCNPPAGIRNNVPGRIPGTNRDQCDQPALSTWKIYQVDQLTPLVEAELNTIWTAYTNETNLYEMDSDILRRGWAGAGIWYNTIARLNGDFMSAARDIPIMTKYPDVMNKIAAATAIEGNSITQSNRFCPEFRTINLETDNQQVGKALCSVIQYWDDARENQAGQRQVIMTGSAFEDTMNLIFGTEAMTANNPNIHPLAHLTIVGKGLVDASIRNIATASIGSALGGLSVMFDRILPGLIAPSSEFILSTAFVGLTAGLVLYYIVPFLPFIYFFFAVASWVKSIFEAMVGVPLWALAHLRIDGDGLPGSSAMNGYFLIFEIFLRPILTVFGLIAATLIFTAQVRVLDFLWDIVTQNLTGYNEDPLISIAGEGRFAFKRSIIDTFFFSIIYTIIVYMMAIAAFKLIDKIPDNLLRWMGNQVSSFGDINQDSVEGLTRYAALGGATAGRELASSAQGLGAGAGGNMGTLLARMTGGR